MLPLSLALAFLGALAFQAFRLWLARGRSDMRAELAEVERRATDHAQATVAVQQKYGELAAFADSLGKRVADLEKISVARRQP
jgi:hypothetical protein